MSLNSLAACSKNQARFDHRNLVVNGGAVVVRSSSALPNAVGGNEIESLRHEQLTEPVGGLCEQPYGPPTFTKCLRLLRYAISFIRRESKAEDKG